MVTTSHAAWCERSGHDPGARYCTSPPHTVAGWTVWLTDSSTGPLVIPDPPPRGPQALDPADAEALGHAIADAARLARKEP
jgi:hypothetical protein